jgi:fatty-acyl-CoA synthase
VLEAFSQHMKPAGFDPSAFLPSYGMAETTLAISFPDLGEPVFVDVIDKAEYKANRKAVPAQAGAGARSFVACGKPLAGHALCIVDDEGRVLGEREIGHILTKGPSLMNGYYEDAASTAAVMREDGFMDTGDMGYFAQGQLVITGRAKDLILYHGRNIWPQDIEWAAEHIEPLRSGDVAAFNVEDDEGEDHVTVLVQCRLNARAEMDALIRKVSAAVHHSVGIEVRVVLVAPKSLPFTSSGKLSRAAAKIGYLSGEIAELAEAQPLKAAAGQ